MNCPQLISISKEACIKNPGGLKLEAFIFPTESRKNLQLDESSYTVAGVEYSDGVDAVLPVSISFHKNTANMTESKAGTIETANETNTVTLSITVNVRQYNKSKAINILGAGGRELDVVFSQANNTNWFIPNAILTQTDSNSGTVRQDGSNYVLTFTAELDDLLYGIEEVDMNELITTGKITFVS